EDGRLTDGKGRTVDFRNTVIIMTSNVGVSLLRREGRMGFRQESPEDSYQAMKERIMDELKRTFRPEFLNRLDEIIVFHQLSREDLMRIVDLMLATFNRRLEEHGLKVEVAPEAKKVLAERGFDEVYGARPLRRAIQQMLEDPLSEGLLEGRFAKGDTIRVTARDGELILEKK
ncbi:MAG: ATP-dependent Clp protease ATP-binding subunit, partial [Firmicutes bacterium]|nr:ATP-dependent Clp protease ATP-binding subunit [Bacillota bacterium]